jgi:ubiquinone/menaquinone biosynthesis C-methylase UbiE
VYDPALTLAHVSRRGTVNYANSIMSSSKKPTEGTVATKATWAAGDFPKMGVELAIVGELLCDAVPVYAGDRVLDVATASGNTAISAARRRAVVTGIDLVPSLLSYAQRRAEIEGLNINFCEGDVMALAFPDASFDVVTSTFGAIFAPDPRKTAAEMARVCRPRGSIAMASWTPDSLMAELFVLLARYSNPKSRVDDPVEWGKKEVLQERLGPYVRDVRISRREVSFRARGPESWVRFMQEYFGPAIDALGYSNSADTKKELTKEIRALADRHNRAPNKTFLGRSEYLEVIGVRRD